MIKNMKTVAVEEIEALYMIPWRVPNDDGSPITNSSKNVIEFVRQNY